jgi:hypothetical protein
MIHREVVVDEWYDGIHLKDCLLAEGKRFKLLDLKIENEG